jgi:hypothetical protein
MPEVKDLTQSHLRHLGPKRALESETAWVDPWEATKEAREAIAPQTRARFLEDLHRVGRQITDEISRDPEEVRRLRESIRQADEGQARPMRRSRASKSG